MFNNGFTFFYFRYIILYKITKGEFEVENTSKNELDLKEIVAKRINLLLKNNRLTHKALADKCGLAKAIINKAAKGDMSIKSALIISETLGVSLDYLYGRDEEENRNQYALELFLKHFRAVEGRSYWDTSLMEVHISISYELDELLKTISDLTEARIDDDLRREGIQRAKAAFLQVMDNPLGRTKKYVLLDPNLYTSEVRAIIKGLKENMERQLQN